MDGVEKFQGKWKQYQAENMEDFLKEMGVNFLVRKLARSAKPEMTIDVTGGLLTVSTAAGFFSRVDKVQLNSDTQREDEGVMMNYSGRMEGDKLVTTQEPTDKKRKKATVQRELTQDGDMLQTMLVGDVVCKRWFKRIQ